MGLLKLEQKNRTINLSGKSRFELESHVYNSITLILLKKDSAEVVFEMLPDLKTSEPTGLQTAGLKGQVITKSEEMDLSYIMIEPLL